MTVRPNSTIRIAAVGDLSFGDHPLCLGFGVRSLSERKGVLYPLQQVGELLAGYDAVLGNLETVLSDAGLQRQSLKSRQMRGMPRSVECLATAGFTAVSLANNHAMQHGPEAFRETESLLRSHGIAPLGVTEDHRQAIPTILTVKGVRLGLLAYSLRPRPHSPRPPLYTEGEPDRILRDIGQLSNQVHHVVVSIHWGEEFVPWPAPSEVAFARQMVDAGASVILGHHPHVLRAVETYKQAVICYSLGNFIFDMPWDKRTEASCIVELECTEEAITKTNIIPIQINSGFQPVRPSSGQAENISAMLAGLSEALHRNGSTSPAQYEKQCREALRRHQWARRSYFLTHLFKYDPRIFCQQLTNWVKGRLCTS